MLSSPTSCSSLKCPIYSGAKYSLYLIKDKFIRMKNEKAQGTDEGQSILKPTQEKNTTTTTTKGKKKKRKEK